MSRSPIEARLAIAFWGHWDESAADVPKARSSRRRSRGKAGLHARLQGCLVLPGDSGLPSMIESLSQRGGLGEISIAGRQIAYRLRQGRSPAIVYLPGYASDMEGTKALALDELAKAKRHAMLRLDYSGTGSSGGRFEDGTLALWIEETLAAIDELVDGPLILVGSSMGGWVALHLALLRPERIRALVGIAAAPDFTDWGFSSAEKEALRSDGRLERPNPYGPEPQLFTHSFWQSGERLRLLEGEIAIDCEVRLLHGELDEDVPLDIAFRLLRALRSSDVQLNVLKGGGHRLSQPREIRVLVRTVEDLLEP